MSFVNDQGDEEVGLAELPGLELPETPGPSIPTRAADARRRR